MKTIVYFVVGLLIFSGFAAVGIGKEAGVIRRMHEQLELAGSGNEDTIELVFSRPIETLVDRDRNGKTETYVELEVEEANSFFGDADAGEPMLPRYVTTLSYTFGTKILDVECEIKGVTTKELNHKIVPAPESIPVAPYVEGSVGYKETQAIYGSGELYPDGWFSYYTGGGLDADSEHKTFLTLIVYPVRYSPATDTTDTIYYIENCVLKITYEEPETSPFPKNGAYDMVIIAPTRFSTLLQKLVDHKNSHGVPTTLKTTNSIYLDALLGKYDARGRDKPEMIKYFIKYAIENWDIKYVLLVGGLKSLIYGKPRDDDNKGQRDWFVPVRFSNLVDDYPEYGYVSDLYYADIYDSGGAFDDWDSNGNGIFAEWGAGGKDILDLYPDVYVGRLACRNILEVMTMVNKIINYEKSAAGSWFDTMVYVGGDSFNEEKYGIPLPHYAEGEEVCENVSNNYMTGFTPVKLYASNKDIAPQYTPTPENFLREVDAGCGHLLLDGHGNPAAWCTHWLYPSLGGPGGWTPIINQMDHFTKLTNGGKLPVCIVGGCHNSMFTVSLVATYLDLPDMWTYGTPIPECWSWFLASKTGGGSIATMGNTGLGYGLVGHWPNGDPACIHRYGGLQEIAFYMTLDEGVDILGEAWGGAVSKYLDIWPGMAWQGKIDCKTVQQWPLLGDPSLKIGGYTSSSGDGVKAKIVDAAAGVVATPGEHVTLQAYAYDGSYPYTYEWDFGDGATGTGIITTHSYSEPGVYWVSLKATDSVASADTYETIVKVEPLASAPDMPRGETDVIAGETYIYITGASNIDPYWNKIYYQYDWGDDTYSEWLGPYDHDDIVQAAHGWSIGGRYTVKVTAILTHDIPDEDENVQKTDWSPSTELRVSNQQTLNPLFLQILEKLLPNLK